MEYRQLPRGNKNERFSVLGLGMGGIGKTPVAETEDELLAHIRPYFAAVAKKHWGNSDHGIDVFGKIEVDRA